MATIRSKQTVLDDARRRLEPLSPDRLQNASDLLAYLQERERSEATEELLTIPGFEDAFRRAIQQVEESQIVGSEDVWPEV